jgi:hypothetical protein
MNLLPRFELISLLISMAALVVVIWQTRALRLQLRANFHQEYVRRYIDIIKQIPVKALYDPHMSLADCELESTDFKITARLYFWTIQEEYDLHRKNMLPRGQWDIWDGQFRIMMENKWLQEAWYAIHKSLALPGSFINYVQGVCSKTGLDKVNI